MESTVPAPSPFHLCSLRFLSRLWISNSGATSSTANGKFHSRLLAFFVTHRSYAFVRSFDSSKRISTNSSTKDFPFCVDYPLQPPAIKLPPRVIYKNISSLIRAKVFASQEGGAILVHSWRVAFNYAYGSIRGLVGERSGSIGGSSIPSSILVSSFITHETTSR